MPSADDHPKAVSACIQKEMELGQLIRVDKAGSTPIHTSPFGVIPKKSRNNKWRLILDLSSSKNKQKAGVPKCPSSPCGSATAGDVLGGLHLCRCHAAIQPEISHPHILSSGRCNGVGHEAAWGLMVGPLHRQFNHGRAARHNGMYQEHGGYACRVPAGRHASEA